MPGFDPNEPRDALGRWTESIGTAIHEAASDKKDKIKKALEDGIDTKTLYAGDPQREAMREKIADQFVARGKSTDNPTAEFIGPAPANGKSTLLDSGLFTTPDNDVRIDADAIKGFIPEYNPLIKGKNIKAAAFVHEESSDIANKVLDRAIKMKSNVTWDAVFDENYEKVLSKIQKLKKENYNIKFDMVTLDTPTAFKLMNERFEKQGRYVEETFFYKANRNMPDIFQKLAASGAVNELNLWDTNEYKKPKLIATAVGGKLNIVNDDLWKRFLKKAE